MAASIPRTGTEYAWAELTLIRGTVTSATPCGIFFTALGADPPAVGVFHDAIMVPPGHEELGDGERTWVTQLVGPDSSAPEITLTAGDWQMWVLVTVGNERIIRRPGILTVL